MESVMCRYAAAILLAFLLGQGAWAQSNVSVRAPAAKLSPGLPVLPNSPDMLCDADRQCNEREFAEQVANIRVQWKLAPDWLKARCVANATYPALEGCIFKQTLVWLNANPGLQAPCGRPVVTRFPRFLVVSGCFPGVHLIGPFDIVGMH
jgi:hypothetical protein